MAFTRLGNPLHGVESVYIQRLVKLGVLERIRYMELKAHSPPPPLVISKGIRYMELKESPSQPRKPRTPISRIRYMELKEVTPQAQI